MHSLVIHAFALVAGAALRVARAEMRAVLADFERLPYFVERCGAQIETADTLRRLLVGAALDSARIRPGDAGLTTALRREQRAAGVAGAVRVGL
jgi:hypothetical protein